METVQKLKFVLFLTLPLIQISTQRHYDRRDVNDIELAFVAAVPVNQPTYTYYSRVAELGGKVYTSFFQQENLATLDANTFERGEDLKVVMAEEMAHAYARWGLYANPKTNTLYVHDAPTGGASEAMPTLIWNVDPVTGDQTIFKKFGSVGFMSVSQFSGNILVMAKSQVGGAPAVVSIYDSAETFLRNVTLSVNENTVRQIVENPAGIIVALLDTNNQGKHSVAEFDAAGKQVKSIEVQTEDSVIYMNIVSDESGNIYVNSVLHLNLISPDMTLTRRVLRPYTGVEDIPEELKEAFWMTGLAYSSTTGRLYVASFESGADGMNLNVKIFEYPKFLL